MLKNALLGLILLLGAMGSVHATPLIASNGGASMTLRVYDAGSEVQIALSSGSAYANVYNTGNWTIQVEYAWIGAIELYEFSTFAWLKRPNGSASLTMPLLEGFWFGYTTLTGPNTALAIISLGIPGGVLNQLGTWEIFSVTMSDGGPPLLSFPTLYVDAFEPPGLGSFALALCGTYFIQRYRRRRPT